MNGNDIPVNIYENRKADFKDLYDKNKKYLNKVSWLRLFVFFFFCFTIYKILSSSFLLFWLTASFVFFIIFIILIIKYGKINSVINYYSRLVDINTNSSVRVSGYWSAFHDDGDEYKNYDHRFTFDLDVFGNGSLFQWINVTNSPLGRLELKKTLSEPVNEIGDIKKRQSAISELASKLDFRQYFQAEGIGLKEDFKSPEGLLKWAEEDSRVLSNRMFLFFIRLFPVITVSLSISVIFIPSAPKSLPFLPVLIQLVVILVYNKRINRLFKLAGLYKDDIKLYYSLLKRVEDEKFNEEYLIKLRSILILGNNTASVIVKKLENIVDYMNLRFSSIHFIINMFTFWDFHCIIALEKWKGLAGGKIGEWLKIIGKLESLSSIAVIGFDNPRWVVPELTDEKYQFIAENISHPLISENTRVHNNLKINGSGNILIITGSNMSGKSTLLRTVGINLILAYAGAPVCAGFLKCSIMNICSSMRINDSLEKSISSFYAELLRIKMILEASENDGPVMFLLDEIFRGTNSSDRKKGAERVLKKLWENNAIGLAATHDLELAGLSNDAKMNFKNFYFMETYKDNKINFDYKLRSGVSNTTDAIYLMKMIGIDFD